MTSVAVASCPLCLPNQPLHMVDGIVGSLGKTGSSLESSIVSYNKSHYIYSSLSYECHTFTIFSLLRGGIWLGLSALGVWLVVGTVQLSNALGGLMGDLDGSYVWIARLRYRWAMRVDTCTL